MHPKLISFDVPKWMIGYFGPKSTIFSMWKIIAFVFVGCMLLSFLKGDDKKKAGKTAFDHLRTLLTLVSGVLLAGVGLVKLGKVELHTYGVMIATAFIVGISLAAREAKKIGENPEQVVDVAFWLLIAGVGGSRLLYILIGWKEYLADLNKVQHWYQWKLFRIWEGGLVFYGGLICASLAVVFFTRRYKMNFWKFGDILIPSVALGQFFGRLGCFAAGCCHGKKTTVAWAVTFTQGLGKYKNTPIHPTQLYESTTMLFIFLALLFVRSRKKFHGQTIATYFLLYPIARFTIEIFRGDKIRGFVPGMQIDLFKSIQGPEILSTSQSISLVLLFLGAAIYLTQKKKAEQKG